jgi:hypothetical protein
MSEYRRAMVAHLEQNEAATLDELAVAAGISPHVAQRQLRIAGDLGFIERSGDRDGEPLYALTSAGDTAGESPSGTVDIDGDDEGAFTPAGHSVTEIRAYLADHPNEVDRVVKLERESDHPRKGVLELAG